MSVVVEFSSSSNNESTDSESNPDDSEKVDVATSASSSVQYQKKPIVTPYLAMTLDSTKTSDRNAFMVLASTVNALGVDINDVVLSRSTLQRQRGTLRKKIFLKISQVAKIQKDYLS